MSKSADKIIANSISLFREKGFNGTSISDIATATGILKGSLYSHFASKEMILLEVIQKVETIFFDYIQLKASKNIEEILKRTADFFIEQESCLMATLLSESIPPMAHSRIIDFFQNWKENLLLALDENIEPDLKSLYTEDIITLFEGSVIMMKVVQKPDPIHRCLNQLIEKYKSLLPSASLSGEPMKTQNYDYMDVLDNGNDDTLVCDISDACSDDQAIDTKSDVLKDSGNQ